MGRRCRFRINRFAQGKFGAQRFDNHFHVHAARAFDKQQIARRDKLGQGFRGFVGGHEKSRLLGTVSRANCTAHEFFCIARNAENPRN
jgi:hypothetical protein